MNTTSATVNTILSETRKTLVKSEVEGPYILMIISMSGVEASCSAQ